MESQRYDYLFRLVMVGDSGVGKTNLLTRYTTSEFNFETKTTIGAQFSQKMIKLDDKNIEAQIWDTAGQERYMSVTATYFRGAVGALLVYDVCNENSFKNLEKWLKFLKDLAEPDVVIVLVGNKSDLTNLRVVPCEDAQRFAQLNNLEFIETSALNGQNVELAFDSLAKKIFFLVKEKEKSKGKYSDVTYKESQPHTHKLVTLNNKKKKKTCC